MVNLCTPKILIIEGGPERYQKLTHNLVLTFAFYYALLTEIRQYVKWQKEKDRRSEQLKLWKYLGEMKS
jgi:hypothetical protein